MKPLFRLLASFSCGVAMAEPPKFDALFPAGGQIGTEFMVTVVGEVGADSRWWTDAPGVEFEATEKPEEWNLSISPETPAGLYQIILYHEEGAAPTRWFSVGKLPELAEAEPNDEVGKGQVLENLPACVNGRLDKAGDVDGYEVSLKSGETLVAMVEAYTIGSPVDVLAHVVNPRGERVATFSDGRNLDPFIAFTAPADGTYTLQIAGFAHPPAANVEFAGGPAVVYRLHLSTGPVVTHFHPAVVHPGETTEVTLHGYNLDDSMRSHSIGPDSVRGEGDLVLVDLPHSLLPVQAVSHEGPLMTEPKGPVTPGVIGGVLEDEDRYAIEMTKGQKLEARVRAKSLGLPLDATLRIEDPDGKVLVTVDDFDGQPDPMAEWTAGADGIYQVIVTDNLGGGDKPYFYVLEIGEPEPSLQAVLSDPKPLVLEAGKSITVKLNVKRSKDHKQPLVLRVEGLPEDVHAEEAEVPEKGGDVEIELTAAADAVSSNQPVAFMVVGKEDGGEVHIATAKLRGDLARGTSILDETSRLWLTVKAAATEEAAEEEE